MRRLSSVIRPSLDRWLTLGMVVLTVLVVAWVWVHVRDGGKVPWGAVVVWGIVGMAQLLARSRRALAYDVVDEAWADGGELLLKRAGQTIRMSLTNVAAVDADRWSRLVTLDLCLPCAFGSRIRFFVAPRRIRDIGAELRQRLVEVRRNA